MDKLSKSRIFTWLLALLLLANAVTLVFFWIGRPKDQVNKGNPKDFLVKELNFDDRQQKQFEELRQDHRRKTEALREKVKVAKDDMFELIKEPETPDSSKQLAARRVSLLTEEIDVNTLNHFQQVRALCNEEQRQKFDGIIRQLTRMMGNQRPGRPNGPGGPGGPGGVGGSGGQGRERGGQGPPQGEGEGHPPKN
jgi:periplasmic protein CpxP/Spy